MPEHGIPILNWMWWKMFQAETMEDGFDSLLKQIESSQIDNQKIVSTLEMGAKEFAKDVRKLPRPRSRMSGSGYTHLIDTVTTRKLKSEVEVGWGKYYGPMVEHGTRKMKGTPHMNPTYEKNKKKYYDIMKKNLFK